MVEDWRKVKILRSIYIIVVRAMNETYRRFLVLESKRYPLKMSRNTVSWESEDRGSPSEADHPRDILEFMYLERGTQDAVVMDKRVAAMLQDRLRNLEEENQHLRGRVRIMKFLVGGLVVVALLLTWMLIEILFFPIYM